ncbi:nucleotidyl transferase AbiEii/AbiGii toxin family protein [Kitasatospora sp. NPDC057936]|uniref:nucleotidyl transferase AbiEii/AbiGii toxin family protein n=1 Tax=Kitasatospora sp. NPDC057936 TaxID=3346283 RepID=UPI0036DA44E9
MTEDRTATWEDLPYGPWEDVVLPKQPPSEEVRAEQDLPRSLRPIDDETVTQQPVFDPALAGYARALRPSEPAFADPAVAARWLAARREALNAVLSAVARSAWAEHLVLRGSVLLRAWYGDEAREPGDLDFVVRPVEWQLEDERTGRMLDELAASADESSSSGAGACGVRLHADRAVADEIWTYSRVPGRRLVLPWTAPGVPEGTVQLDFVFTEHLPAEPRQVELPGVDGPLVAATPELSLGWKILWLISDNHPQGKDLHDAVLLARTARVPYELLRDVFLRSEENWAWWPVLPDAIAELDVDWDEFAKDHPAFTEAVEAYPAELLASLAPTFAGRGEYALRALWMAPVVDGLRELMAREGLDAVLRHLSERRTRPERLLMVASELLDGDLERAHQAVITHLDDPADPRLKKLQETYTRLATDRAAPTAP